MENLRKQLVDAINNCGLPLEAAYYIMKDVYRDLSDTYESYLKQQEAQKEAESASEKELENVEEEEVE